MSIATTQLASVLQAKIAQGIYPGEINYLSIDSRTIRDGMTTLFFAMSGTIQDGHQFLSQAYEKGVRNFVISKAVNFTFFPEANFFLVNSAIRSLQRLAAWHRAQFVFPVIGITGSNGKTTVKEWIYHLLKTSVPVVRSPRSYNSQIGVPLSVWEMDTLHQLAIIETGISELGEMHRLAQIISADFGIFTNIGTAHDDGFSSTDEKIKEKLFLFENARHLLIRNDKYGLMAHIPPNHSYQLHTWSIEGNSNYVVSRVKRQNEFTHFSLRYNEFDLSLAIPFTTEADLENAVFAIITALHFGADPAELKLRCLSLPKVAMRLEILKGTNHTTLINDVYNADLLSLDIALDHLSRQSQHSDKMIILSDLEGHRTDPSELYLSLIEKCNSLGIKEYYGIGPVQSGLSATLQNASIETHFFIDKTAFISYLTQHPIKDKVILIKGARSFAMEEIVGLLAEKQHDTVLEIDLQALSHNLRYYRSLLNADTRVMAMVKASSYGAGSFEIAQVLAELKTDYLGVAYADEGVDLRRNGIKLPVMVMNVRPNHFEQLIENSLEPEIYSLELLEKFLLFVSQKGVENYPIHLKLDTGMHRLGIEEGDMPAALNLLSDQRLIVVRSIFTHLCASEDDSKDSFVHQQNVVFERIYAAIVRNLAYRPWRHILNSGGVANFPAYQYEMVRLGLGLYGVGDTEERFRLLPVHSLRSFIAQKKRVKDGDRVGYTVLSNISEPLMIATINIGYADGLPRAAGNGKASVWVKNKMVPILGNICMDMCMIDVTGVQDIEPGDEVVIFGERMPVEELAKKCGTIPYEILSRISARVKRIYVKE